MTEWRRKRTKNEENTNTHLKMAVYGTELAGQSGVSDPTFRLYYRATSARTLRSLDKLLLTVPRMSAKAFSVSALSVWNSLSYNRRSAELLSTFKHFLKTELLGIAYRKRDHPA